MKDLGLSLYRQMLLIRGFEDACTDLYQKGELYGTTHLYSGQEAIAVGMASVLEPQDRVAATYRGHGHSLALGTDPDALMGEMLGRSTGVCGGRAGSMNVIDLRHRLIGCFGIVGGSISAATGAALALRRNHGVAVAYFGDGAANQGYFHECLNFAKVASLPVVYVCENNGYGEYTPFESVTAGSIVDRPKAMGIPSESIDGNDVWVTRQAMENARKRAASGEGPVFIEARTYRFVGHSRADPGKYRREGELDRWRLRDPLVLAAARLREEHGATESDLKSVESEVKAQLAAAVANALKAPFPDPLEERPTEFKSA
jgi:TPP-dependent pyruvate/acetoin dehydrogenase alpha subunit